MSDPDEVEREALRVTVQEVLWNASNYPEAVQARLLGQDTSPLTTKVVDAVLASGWRPATKMNRYGIVLPAVSCETQHCTAVDCYTFSHTAAWCGSDQHRPCGCRWCAETHTEPTDCTICADIGDGFGPPYNPVDVTHEEHCGCGRCFSR